MAEVEILLVARLRADTEVAALVGTRIYPMVLPQAPQLPAIAYSRISGDRLEDHTDSLALEHPVIQISCFGESYADARALARAVIAALVGWTEAGIQGALVQGPRDLYDEDTKTHQAVLEAEVWHPEG